jgi:hypothetical protein
LTLVACPDQRCGPSACSQRGPDEHWIRIVRLRDREIDDGRRDRYRRVVLAGTALPSSSVPDAVTTSVCELPALPLTGAVNERS